MTKKKSRSQHLFTSRTDSTHRILILVAMVVFLFFIFCSAYAVSQVPANPAAWSMAAFFVIGFLILMGVEENVFPDIPKQKIPYSVVTWFFVWVFVAFLVSFFITMNLAHLGLTLLFGLLAGIGSIYLTASEKGWNNFKTQAKAKTGGKIKSKLRTRSKKKKPKKTKKRRIQSW